MQDFITFFGHGFCHQIENRCFEAGGFVFSVCSRDTGIYMGFVFALLAAFIVYAAAKEKPGEIARWPYLVFLAAMVLPMAIDGGTSYLGLRETNNTIRYFTGVTTGLAAGSLIAPLLIVLNKNGNPDKKIFSRPQEYLPHLLITLALSTAFFFIYPYLGVVAPLMVIAAFMVLVVSVNLILITLSRRLAPKHTIKHWALLLAIVLVMAVIEITLFGFLRDLSETLLLGGQDISKMYPQKS